MKRTIKLTIFMFIFTLFCSFNVGKVYAEPTAPPSPPATEEKENSGGIFDAITNLPEKLMEAVTKPLKQYYQYKIEKVSSQVQATLGIFEQWLKDDDINSSKFNFSKQIFNGMLPISYSLLGLFFVIDFCKKATYFQVLDYTHIAKLGIKLVMAKELVKGAYSLLAAIVAVNRKIVSTIFSIGNSSNIVNMFKFNDLMDKDAIKINPLSLLMEHIELQIFMFFIIILLALVFVILNVRNLELAVLTGLAPLYFATFAGEVTNDVFKSYIKSYVSVVMQTAWMAAGLVFLTSGYLGTFTGQGLFAGNIFKLLVGILTLTIFILKAPSSLKNAIGGASPAGEMSLSSMVNLLR